MKIPSRTTRVHLAPSFAVAALFTLALTSGCRSDSAVPVNSPDPALANLAPVPSNQLAPRPAAGQPTRVLGQNEAYQPSQQSENYPSQQGYDNSNTDPNYDRGYNSGSRRRQPYYESTQAPPPLRVSQQPPAPAPNYIWTPGNWGYNNGQYVWNDGAWTAPPYAGALWTPSYWSRNGDNYRLNPGYWGRHVGYYGGIDYGSGYVGSGYYGGYWNGKNFYYNKAVNTLGNAIPYVYDRPVLFNGRRYGAEPLVRISFNGLDGVNYAPQPYEVMAMREAHIPGIAIQLPGVRPDYGPRQGYYDDRLPPIAVREQHHDNGWHGHRNDARDYGYDRGDFHDEGRGHGKYKDKDKGDHHDNGEGHGNGKGHDKGHGKD